MSQEWYYLFSGRVPGSCNQIQKHNTQVFLNLELHLSPLAPRHSSLAAALNYRRTRHTAFQQLQAEQQGDNTTHRGTGEQVRRGPHYNERLL